MTLQSRIGLATGFLALITSFVLNTGCTPAAVHPNQINAFDGATFDVLTLAHGALTSLHTSVAQDYPTYSPLFDTAATAYNDAVTAYGVYRTSKVETTMSATIQSLTAGIVLLETTLQNDLHIAPKQSASIRASARKLRTRAAESHISVSDLLTELEIAAAMAQTAPAAQPYSTLANIIIQATTNALSAEEATSGKPIDLQTLTPIALIN